MHTKAVLVLLVICALSGAEGRTATQLMDTLMNSYKSYVMPDIPINVTMQMSLLAINSLDILNGLANLEVYMRLWWQDDRLTWNPSTYEGIEEMQFLTDVVYKTNLIWVPEIFCARCLSDTLSATKAVANYTGGVYWRRHGVVSVGLPFALDDYPYDKQTLEMSFFGWSMPINYMNLSTNGDFDYSHTIKNIQWDIVGAETIDTTRNYINQTFGVVEYHVHFKRVPTTLEKGVIVPGIAIAFLALLYIFMKKESGLRLTYLTTILLNVVLFLQMMTGFMP